MILPQKIQNAIQSNSEACTQMAYKKIGQLYVRMYDCFSIMRLFL